MSETNTIPVHIVFKEYTVNKHMLEILNKEIINAISSNANAMIGKTVNDVDSLAPEFSFIDDIDHMSIKLDPKKWFTKIKFTDKLAAFFDYEKVIDKKTTFLLNNSIVHIDETIYVYCDIIQDQYVGDTMAPLLRTVRTSSDKSNMSIMYENPHYVPVKTTRINTINISIMDHFGKQILFSNKLKRTIVKLHFKKHGL